MDAKEANIYHAILITGIVIGIIIIYFIISVTRQQRKNLALHRLNILAEITALEKERARIAHDLHDELGPLLSAVKMKINSFDLTDPDDIVQINKTNTHIDDILKRIREISFDLMPNSLLRKGLSTALKEFVDYMNNDNQITFSFSGNINIPVEDKKAINIYRIVQEVSHNAVKYSGATNFTVNLSEAKDHIILVLSDNGNGFDHEKASKETVGFGLRGILSRTEMMGGQMYLDSKPGKGTTYTFEIPVNI
jgi:signal transduction histidine kinase